MTFVQVSENSVGGSVVNQAHFKVVWTHVLPDRVEELLRAEKNTYLSTWRGGARHGSPVMGED